MTAPWTMRPSTRAVSLMGSPRPSWMSLALRNIAWPPSSRMADLEGDAGARGGLGENHRPDLAGERLRAMTGRAPAFMRAGCGEDVFHVRQRQFFDAQQMFHGKGTISAASCDATDSMMARPSSRFARARRFSAGRSRMICVPAGMASRPAACSRLMNRMAGVLPSPEKGRDVRAPVPSRSSARARARS